MRLKIDPKFIPTNTFRLRILAEVLLRLSRLQLSLLPCAPAPLNLMPFSGVFSNIACLLWSFPQHFSKEGWTCVLPSAMRSWSVALPRCPPQGTKPLLFCTSWWEIILSSPKGEHFWEHIFRSVAGEKLETGHLRFKEHLQQQRSVTSHLQRILLLPYGQKSSCFPGFE